MKRALVLLAVIPVLAACEMPPSFEEKCRDAGHLYDSTSDSQYKYAYVATKGTFDWVWVHTTTEVCIDESTGKVLDMEVS